MRKPLIPVSEAIARIAEAMRVMPKEEVSLSDASGRILADDAIAILTNPPQDQSAMDGYAARGEDITDLPCVLHLKGESAAGHPWPDPIAPGTCVRISTGANIPAGADRIVILENTRSDHSSEQIEILEAPSQDQFIRRKGQDFHSGDVLIKNGTRLNGRQMGLLAAAGHHRMMVRRKPVVAILSTGSELVEPGTNPSAAQIISSNSIMIAEMIAAMGATAMPLPPIPDNENALLDAIAGLTHVDLLVMTGGASVGKHDLVAGMMKDHDGLDFWRIAMRPGKPMIFGHIAIGSAPSEAATTPLLGLPGNPVSSGVCTLIFVRAAIRAMLGLSPVPVTRKAILTTDLPANDQREEYMRGMIQYDAATGLDHFTPLLSQDSGKMKDFALAEALMIRPAHATALAGGSIVDIIYLNPGD
jgi:molybdopterin molybdotransferase